MQARFAPSPDPGELVRTPLHVVVRDLPEALAVLRERGVDVAALGAAPLEEAVGDPSGLAEAILEVARWRDRRPGG